MSTTKEKILSMISERIKQAKLDVRFSQSEGEFDRAKGAQQELQSLEDEIKRTIK